MKRLMATEEASLKGGWFDRILDFYERSMRRVLKHPAWLGAFCVLLIAAPIC